MTKSTFLQTLKHIIDLFGVNTFRPLDATSRNIDDSLIHECRVILFSDKLNLSHLDLYQPLRSYLSTIDELLYFIDTGTIQICWKELLDKDITVIWHCTNLTFNTSKTTLINTYMLTSPSDYR